MLLFLLSNLDTFQDLSSPTQELLVILKLNLLAKDIVHKVIYNSHVILLQKWNRIYAKFAINMQSNISKENKAVATKLFDRFFTSDNLDDTLNYFRQITDVLGLRQGRVCLFYPIFKVRQTKVLLVIDPYG